MEQKNDDLFLEFDAVMDVNDNHDSDFIAKGLFLNQCINTDHYDYVEELLVDIIDDLNDSKKEQD